MWQGEKADYDARPRVDGKVVGEASEVQAAVRSMNNKLLGAYVAGGIGAIGLGLGAWWLFSDGAPKVAILPTEGGAAVQRGFAFGGGPRR